MSERKHTFHYLVFTETELYGDVYSKNDVDNVIAERDKVIEEQDNEIARQKRKRCLALAKWCASRSVPWGLDNRWDKVTFYDKWKEIWLKLADKLKEA